LTISLPHLMHSWYPIQRQPQAALASP
jgi:hypothetical protein